CLDRDVKDLRSKIQVLVRKGERDDKLIKLLQEELKTRDDTRAKRDNTFIRNLQHICGEKEEQIQTLERAIGQLRKEMLQRGDDETEELNRVTEVNPVYSEIPSLKYNNVYSM
ncbi:hypothetical protein HDU76_005036, partial [Blyttiomyces sp. JEL0837]